MNQHPELRGVVTSVTVPEGAVRRQYEQTASRDHNVTLTAGTYPVKAIRSPEGYLTDFSASIPAVAEPHWASTVEYGGVALKGEQRGGEQETYGLHFYAAPYFIEQLEKAGYVFGYEDLP